MGHPSPVPVPLRLAKRATSHISPEAKLTLIEFLLGCEDPEECARRSLHWLGEQARIRQALCLSVDVSQNRLLCLAGYKVAPDRMARFSLDLEDRGHPLVAVLFENTPARFGWEGGEARTPPSNPFRSDSFLVIPLYGLVGKEDVPAGLLLITPARASLGREARWVASLLGHRMARMGRIRALAEAEGRHRRERMLLDAVSDPILLTDTSGRMLIANTRARNLLEASEADSLGRRRAVALNNMLLSSALAQSAIQDGASLRRELLLVDPSEGSDLLFEMLGSVTSDPREGTAIVSILRNVTDLRRATEEIEENYRRLRVAEANVRGERDRLDLIIDSVADPILVTDPAGSIVMMNAPAERLFTVPSGATDEEAARVQANDAHFSSFVSNLFFEGEALRRRGHVSLVDPQTGAALPVEAISGKILTEHGEVTTVVSILHDRAEELEKARLYEQLKEASEKLEEKVREATSELVRQNELLRRQSIELEQASALKSQFLANMSHEFRTPLNAILGYTSLLLQGVSGELNEQQAQNLSRVDSNARHLVAIINDILDISRIEAGKMPLRLTSFGLPELIREVMAELEPIIALSKLEVKSDLGLSLPQLLSDRAKVKQIVLNLLSNALKFTPRGSVCVSTTYDPSAKEVSIAVTDTGIGIAEEDREKIFEDFRQADSSSTREYGGAGLGLAICRRLASMLGGRIALESAVGKGSAFMLLLPRQGKRR